MSLSDITVSICIRREINGFEINMPLTNNVPLTILF